MAIKQIREETKTGLEQKPGFPGKTLREGIFDSDASRTILEKLVLELRELLCHRDYDGKSVSTFVDEMRKTFRKEEFFLAMISMTETAKKVWHWSDGDLIQYGPSILSSLRALPETDRLAALAALVPHLDTHQLGMYTDSFKNLTDSLKAAEPSERLNLLLLVFELGKNALGHNNVDLHGETASTAIKTFYPDIGKIADVLSHAIVAGNLIEKSTPRSAAAGGAWQFYRVLAPAVIQQHGGDINLIKGDLLKTAGYSIPENNRKTA